MMRSLETAIRDRIDLDDALSAIAAVAAIYIVTGGNESILALVVGVAVVTPVTDAAFDALGLDSLLTPTIAGVIFGTGVLVAGVVTALDGGRWLGGALVVAGVWIVLDALDRRRHGQSVEDEPDVAERSDLSETEIFAVGHHHGWIVEELREADRPLTDDELRTRTGLTDAEIDRVLEVQGSSGPIDRVGTGYVLDERELGAMALVRTVGKRVSRPFRLFRPAR